MHIKTGSQLALQNRIETFCPQMKMTMASFASQRYADYHDYLFWEQKQAEASALGVPSTPLRIGPVQHHFIAPSRPSRSDQAVNAHTTRAPAPPLSHQGGGA